MKTLSSAVVFAVALPMAMDSWVLWRQQTNYWADKAPTTKWHYVETHENERSCLDSLTLLTQRMAEENWQALVPNYVARGIAGDGSLTIVATGGRRWTYKYQCFRE